MPRPSPRRLPSTIAALALGATCVPAMETAGLVGRYGPGRTGFDQPLFQRIDPMIDMQWEDAPPAPGMAGDDWCARWTGFLRPRFTETYTLTVAGDDGVRLWIGDRLLVDAWQVQPTTHAGNTIDLVAGQAYPIRLEYFDGAGQAAVQLAWESASQPLEVIPSEALHPSAEAAAASPPLSQPRWRHEQLRRIVFAELSIGPWQAPTDSWSWGEGDGTVVVAGTASGGRALMGSGQAWGLGFNVLTDGDVKPGETYVIRARVRLGDEQAEARAWSSYAEVGIGPRQRAGSWQLAGVAGIDGTTFTTIWKAPQDLRPGRVLQFELGPGAENRRPVWLDEVAVFRLVAVP